MIRLRSWLLICAREYKHLQSLCQVQLLENMLFHFQSNFTGAPLEFLQYNYFEELPFLKTYQQQTLKKTNVFISSLKTLGAFSIKFIASVGSFQIEEEFFSFSSQERRKTSRSTVSNPGFIARSRMLLLRVRASMAWFPCATQHLSGLGLHANTPPPKGP